jgi:Protein of unknown function (DUF1449)
MIFTFLERMFVGPLWPASLLLCLAVAYGCLSLLGLFDLDLGIDADVSVPEVPGDFLGGISGITVRWMNLDRLPIILWLSVFTAAFWAVSYFLWYGFDAHKYTPTLLPSLLLCSRNIVIATTLTKLVTEPLSRLFVPAPTFSPSTLIGQFCHVSTSEVTESFGQAKFKTDAAPLLLNIRTDGEHLPKGTRVQIIAFDADRRLYKVTAAPEEVSS